MTGGKGGYHLLHVRLLGTRPNGVRGIHPPEPDDETGGEDGPDREVVSADRRAFELTSPRDRATRHHYGSATGENPGEKKRTSSPPSGPNVSVSSPDVRRLRGGPSPRRGAGGNVSTEAGPAGRAWIRALMGKERREDRTHPLVKAGFLGKRTKGVCRFAVKVGVHLGEWYISPSDGTVCGDILRASPAIWECDSSYIDVQGVGGHPTSCHTIPATEGPGKIEGKLGVGWVGGYTQAERHVPMVLSRLGFVRIVCGSGSPQLEICPSDVGLDRGDAVTD